MKKNYLLTIKAEDRPSLLHLLTGMLSKKCIPITSLNAASTDIHDVVLVTIEISISERELSPLLLKFENIIEVFSAEAIEISLALSCRSAYFRVDRALLASPQALTLTKFDAHIVNIHQDSVTINKSGSDAQIRQLYNALEGPYLQGFSQTGLIADTGLICHEDEGRVMEDVRIHRLAA